MPQHTTPWEHSLSLWQPQHEGWSLHESLHPSKSRKKGEYWYFLPSYHEVCLFILIFSPERGFGTRLVKPHLLNFHSPQGLTIDGGFLKTSPLRVLYDISDVTIDSWSHRCGILEQRSWVYKKGGSFGQIKATQEPTFNISLSYLIGVYGLTVSWLLSNMETYVLGK